MTLAVALSTGVQLRRGSPVMLVENWCLSDCLTAGPPRAHTTQYTRPISNAWYVSDEVHEFNHSTLPYA